MTADLFTSLSLRETTVPNRVMVSPMCQYSCENRDGRATDWHAQHLNSRAVGGAGIVMTEATAVDPQGRISPEDLGIWSDDHIDPLAEITSFIKDRGSVPGIQLAHAGRKASTSRPWEGHDPLQPAEGGWDVVGPTDEPYPYGEQEAPETGRMGDEEMAAVTAAFVDAAKRADEAGFEIAELHAAHGYLLHEFLSPVTNSRNDEYGGGFEGRIRFPLEVVGAVRDVWPDEKPLFVRLSATDWLDRESWDVDQSIAFADRVADAGVDFIDVSAGGIHPDQEIPSTGPGYQVPYAERLKNETESDTPIGTVGGITAPEQADELIRNERAEMAILGREHLRDPYFTLHAAHELNREDEVAVPPQYRRAF